MKYRNMSHKRVGKCLWTDQNTVALVIQQLCYNQNQFQQKNKMMLTGVWKKKKIKIIYTSFHSSDAVLAQINMLMVLQLLPPQAVSDRWATAVITPAVNSKQSLTSVHLCCSQLCWLQGYILYQLYIFFSVVVWWSKTSLFHFTIQSFDPAWGVKQGRFTC